MEFLKFFSKFFPLRQMGYRKRSRIPPVNVRRAAKYLKPKGVETAYIFGSGLKIANSAHDLGVVVDLLPTARNKRKFQDATDHGIDLCLLYQAELLFSVGNDEYLYTDNGDLQNLDDVKAKKIEIR